MPSGLEVGVTADHDVRGGGRTPEDFVGQAALLPLRWCIVWHHGLAARHRVEEIDSRRSTGLDEPPDDGREDRIVGEQVPLRSWA